MPDDLITYIPIIKNLFRDLWYYLNFNCSDMLCWASLSGIFKKCKQLPEYYTQESKRLYKMFRPIEIDPYLSVSEKASAMEDWMFAAHQLLQDIEFNPHELKEIAQTYNDILRDGTKELFVKLHNVEIPIIILSAGLGDMVEAILEQHDIFFDKIKVISNFLKYNGNKLAGFKGEKFIHVYNKNRCELRNYEDQERKNILLMGDTIGDAEMIQQIEHTKTVLKIGFLYDHVSIFISVDLLKIYLMRDCHADFF